MSFLFPKANSKHRKEAERALAKLKTDEELLKVVLDEKALYEIREQAEERISDETVLTRILTEEPVDINRFGIIGKVFPRIHSESAIQTLKEYVLAERRIPYSWMDRGMELFRQLNDRDCLMVVFENETDASGLYTNQKQWRLGRDPKLRKQVIDDMMNLREAGVDPGILEERMRAIFPEKYYSEFMTKLYGIGRETMCDLGNHDYVLERVETEENYEDFYHPYHTYYYRCRICGKTMKTDK